MTVGVWVGTPGGEVAVGVWEIEGVAVGVFGGAVSVSVGLGAGVPSGVGEAVGNGVGVSRVCGSSGK